MKVNRCIGYVGNWALEETTTGEYVASLSLSNSEQLRIGPFSSQWNAVDACLKQEKGFEKYTETSVDACLLRKE